jgi:hypothetical protein
LSRGIVGESSASARTTRRSNERSISPSRPKRKAAGRNESGALHAVVGRQPQQRFVMRDGPGLDVHERLIRELEGAARSRLAVATSRAICSLCLPAWL